ncbi:hypothetical protein K1719_042924 [Acacia pycnantha]|nr:hypothetical protein K1719_042924 [Acacia pycnantha]
MGTIADECQCFNLLHSGLFVMNFTVLLLSVKMLESLQDIKIASRLVGLVEEGDNDTDDKYEKLHYHIAPLPVPHDSEDYRRLIIRILRVLS